LHRDFFLFYLNIPKYAPEIPENRNEAQFLP
jgi:hypothetical protein